MVWAVDLIGGNGKGGSKDGPVCYYFGLCFRTQADSALNQSRALAALWKIPRSIYEATLEAHSKVC
jgi:hypothetical protein